MQRMKCGLFILPSGEWPQAHKQKSKEVVCGQHHRHYGMVSTVYESQSNNLWTDVKKAVHICNPTSNEALWMVVKESWKRIAITRCQDLVDSRPRHCAAVIANKGYSTKYKFTS